MVRPYSYTLRRSSALRSTSSVRTAVLLLVAAGLVGVGAYVCWSAVFPSNFPFSCTIPALPLTPKPDSAIAPGSDTITLVPDQIEACSHGSQEIADTTGQGDTLLTLLNANLSNPNSARQVAASLVSVIRPVMSKPFNIHTVLKAGRRYTLTLDPNGRFLKVTLELNPANVFHAVREGNAIKAWKEDVVVEYKVETTSFRVRGSLTESVLNAGEGMELARELSHVFRWDIDFQSESRRGDICKVLFERRYADDLPSGYGSVLCAVYDGKKTGRKVAVFFDDKYYDEKGVELKKNFLRSPLNVIRVTSRYGRRFHPIRKVWCKHKGVDYGAAVGTPVFSVASGVVTFAGRARGYGKYVCIKHENGYESRYGHLHRFFVKKGDRVKQRHRIGLVGMTGEVTGPHLDFQLLKSGKHRDPLKFRMVRTLRTVPSPLKPRFARLAQQRLLALKGMAPSTSSWQQATARVVK